MMSGRRRLIFLGATGASIGIRAHFTMSQRCVEQKAGRSRGWGDGALECWSDATGQQNSNTPTFQHSISPSRTAGGKNGLGHAVNDLLVRGTNGGEHAAE